MTSEQNSRLPFDGHPLHRRAKVVEDSVFERRALESLDRGLLQLAELLGRDTESLTDLEERFRRLTAKPDAQLQDRAFTSSTACRPNTRIVL